MKNLRLLLYVVGLVVLLGSCSKDYLETKPTDSVVPETAFKTTEGAYMAINGIAKLMTSSWISQGFNGEGTIKMFYGNYPGAHFVKDLTGWAPIINSQYHENSTSTYDYYPWWYYYTLINNANIVLERINAALGSESDKKMIRAQALSYRAYSYFMLSQIYCNRWSDSNNGASEGLVMRTTSDNSTEVPLSTLADVYAQVYKDLDDAIVLFAESGKKRKQNYEIDANVAKAIYARAALTRQDYSKAAGMAHDARVGYPLMSNPEYLAGFCAPNKEWIWSSYGSESENLYYYSYFSFIAYNSSASIVRSYPICISKELYLKIPATDMRRGLWFYPGNDKTGSVDIKAEPKVDLAIRVAHPSLASDAITANYMQFKIACQVVPGVGNLNHFRSAEMVLIEAEALARIGGKDTEVQNLLVELNKTSGRNDLYTCDKVGAQLIDEVVLYRAIELWGEGFDWFDLKRTGVVRIRHDKSDATNPGNFLTLLSGSLNPEGANRWTWRIPDHETQYNTGINQITVK